MSMIETKLSASLEDYLEAIYHIERERGAARAKDISARLSVNNSSVTGALRALSERDLINYEAYGAATLTREGEKLAVEVVRRHDTLLEFFVKVLGVEEEQAERAACDMEHAIPREMLERFTRFVDYVERCPFVGPRWTEDHGYSCKHGADEKSCAECIEKAAQELERRRRGLRRGERKE